MLTIGDVTILEGNDGAQNALVNVGLTEQTTTCRSMPSCGTQRIKLRMVMLMQLIQFEQYRRESYYYRIIAMFCRSPLYSAECLSFDGLRSFSRLLFLCQCGATEFEQPKCS